MLCANQNYFECYYGYEIQNSYDDEGLEIRDENGVLVSSAYTVKEAHKIIDRIIAVENN